MRRTQQDSAVHDASRMVHDAQDGQGRDALAAAALPHDAQHPPGGQVESDAVHRPDDPLASEEVSLEIPYREDPVLRHGRHVLLE